MICLLHSGLGGSFFSLHKEKLKAEIIWFTSRYIFFDFSLSNIKENRSHVFCSMHWNIFKIEFIGFIFKSIFIF